MSDPFPAILGGSPAFDAPLLNARARRPPDGELTPLLNQVLESRWFTNKGTMAQKLEAELRERLGAGFLSLACNGTVGLMLALRALDLRGSVVTTPFTFPATAHALAWNGLEPVFADIDPVTKNLDPAAAEAACRADTTALLPVHVFGRPCDVDGLADLALRRGLRIAYDAAHAFGVETRGRPIATFGDLSVFSFHATKLFHTCEGGAIAGPDPGLQVPIDRLRNFGILDEERVEGIGLNGKMSEFHAAVGLALLPGTGDEIAARERVAEVYWSALVEIPGVILPAPAGGVKPNHAYFPVEIDEAEFGLDRDTLHLALRAENIYSRKYFYPLCTANAFYKGLASASPANLPVATRVAARVMTLPMFGDLPLGAVELICDRIRAIHRNARAISSRRVERVR